MPDTAPTAAPVNPALEAARALNANGCHVHYVSNGQPHCISGHCTNNTPKEN